MKTIIQLILCFLVVTTTSANVNVKNGNFFISYTDISISPEAHDLNLSRSYNSSQSGLKGWFGYGWGSYFETSLQVNADGSITILENGNGKRTRYEPKSGKLLSPANAAQRIISAIKVNTKLTDKDIAILKKKLIEDAEMRQIYAARLKVSSKLQGKRYISVQNKKEIISVNSRDYRRTLAGGITQIFSTKGKLIEVRYPEEFTVKLLYKEGKVHQIKSSSKIELSFEWTPDQTIREIKSNNGAKAKYKYSAKRLVESTDADGNMYKLEYATNNNLSKIAYSNGEFRAITYGQGSQFVTSLKERDGDIATYKYGKDKSRPQLKYWTTVNRGDSTVRYDFEQKRLPSGLLYTSKKRITTNGKIKELSFDKQSRPIKAITEGREITLKYKDGRVIEKRDNKKNFWRYLYHKHFNKLIKVTTNKGWASFKYTKKGDLEVAKDSLGNKIIFVRDRKGKIKKLVAKGKVNRTVLYKYNSFGKPSEISVSGLGTLKAAFNNFGELKSVAKTKNQKKIVKESEKVFRFMMDLVRRANTSLSL